MQMVREIFGIDADVMTDPRPVSPMCLPHRLAREVYRTREGDMAAGDTDAPCPSEPTAPTERSRP